LNGDFNTWINSGSLAARRLSLRESPMQVKASFFSDMDRVGVNVANNIVPALQGARS
jgi:hypothetical protein